MEIVERFQGGGGGGDGGGNSAMDRILQRSKDRLTQKRTREEPPAAQPEKSKPAKIGKTNSQHKNFSGQKPIHLTETPEEKKARKMALKQARNERRAAGEEISTAADNVKADSIKPAAAAAVSANASKKPATKEKIPEKPANSMPAVKAANRNGKHETMSVESGGDEDESDEERDEVAEKLLQEAVVPSIGIAKQLFPTDPNNDKSGTAVKKGVEVEDVIETAFVSADMKRLPIEEAVSEWRLDRSIVSKLKEETDVVEFFAVQTAVIPVLLRMNSLECISPRDVCVAAPTGSGKTLAYAVPIMQNLMHRRVTRLRAVVLLPGRELVTQVYKVFQQLTKNTGLRVGVATGHAYFPDEQKFLSPEHAKSTEISSNLSVSGVFSNADLMRRLVPNGSDLGSSAVDILICTPGRLIDHVQFTKGFTLEHLRYLVLDEADRLLGNASDHWVRTLIRSIGSRSNMNTGISGETRSQGADRQGGVQLLLFSATFTDNPRKLAMLGIHAPLVIRVGTESTRNKTTDSDELAASLFDGNDSTNEEEEEGDTVKKQSTREVTPAKVFNLPQQLKESICIGEAAEKPLQLATLLQSRHLRSGKMALVFASSVETTHRLSRLLQLMNGQHAVPFDQTGPEYLFGGLVREMSSLISSNEREVVMAEAAAGKVKVLISSDHLARGIDLPNIDMVVNYDPPKYAKTYVHRVGRTARANRDGESVTMLKLGQIGAFNKMRLTIGGGAGPSSSNDKGLPYDKYRPNVESLSSLKPIYGKAIRKTQAVLEEEQARALFPNEDIPDAAEFKI